MIQEHMPERLLTTGEIARYCQVSNVAVFRWIKAGKLPAFSTPGGHYRVAMSDFRAFLERSGMPIDDDFFSSGIKRILVVDDEPEVAEVIVTALGQGNNQYEFERAADGFDAGLKVASFRPDLVTLDLMMPDVDGFQVCQRLKSEEGTRNIRILIITAFPGDGNLERAMALGADDYLIKPFQLADLRQKVKALLRA
ncbi:MAG: response regulator [Chloroflexi bacterium]|nr:response regulator [Chloroflexota bacterium]